jgi:Rrf2 family cysteine metabolism transcriptional repressor
MEPATMMEISTKGRYSLRILILMASQPQGRVFAKYEIAEEEAITCAYVQQLMTTLRTAGFVRSHRGKMGGFTLARPAETITVAEVLGATEGPIALAPCTGSEHCAREAHCAARSLWAKATEALVDLFTGVTVAQLADGRADGDLLMAPPA